MFSASKTKGASSGYQIANSLRFRSSASAYLNRTPASDTSSNKKGTFSCWVKLGSLASGTNNGTLIGAADGYFYGQFFNNTLYFGNTTSWINTAAVFRDFSAWYHVLFVFDTTQTTAANRLAIYVNGVLQTAGSTVSYPSLNSSFAFLNTTQAYNISRRPTGEYFDGYLAEVNFIDGQALDPSYFGVVAPATGVWSPKRYAGTYGLNGFYLNFSNGTSTTTLGYDASGNSNNWTTNNISLTAGSTYDWMIDSPTPYAGSSYGVGNYCVLMPFTVCNAISPGYGTSSASDGNLNYSSVGSVSNSWSSFALPASGKYYAEMRFASLNTATTGILAYDGNINRSVLFYQNGTIYNNNGLSQSLTAWSSGDTIGFAISMDASTIQFYRNGSAVGTAESITVSYGQYFIFSRYNAALEANFGQRPFAYTQPSGYKSLCSFNLPGPTINNGASYFAATTYTGNGATQSLSNAVNGVSFQPDMVWIKSRSSATDNKLTDSVRGVTKGLISNSTGAETTDTNGLTAFTSNGFTIGSDSVYNASGQTYVAWCWKASNATAVSNTSGSITSQVSANTTSGFSVVTYTGTGANATVGHGLGVAPSMIIVKSRSNGATGWVCYHVSLGASYYLVLNTTDAQGGPASFAWNTTSPTSSVFSLGNGTSVNASGGTFVAYCFAAIAGYSAFGSYTGNGSTDGPFVYCGFRPRYIMVKCTSNAATYWVIWDTARNPYNLTTYALLANTSDAESSQWDCDILSNGFKLRDTEGSLGASGYTYIYAAFAENPFKYSLAR